MLALQPSAGASGDRPGTDLAWAITFLKAERPIVVDRDLIAAFEAASSVNTRRALASDIDAFDLWCRGVGAVTLPATPALVADYLDARAGKGAKPASLARYAASIAKLHTLLALDDPTRAALVKLRLAAIRRKLGTAQAQARPLRFKGATRNVVRDRARGLNISAMLEACDDSLPELRDRALLSLAYDTGLRAAELAAVAVEDVIEALDADARLLRIRRSKGDQEGEGATAYLSPRTVRAVSAWLAAAGVDRGAMFRRVGVRRYAARAAYMGRQVDDISGRERWDVMKTVSRAAIPGRVDYDVGRAALHPGSIGPVFRRMAQRAFDRGTMPDLTKNDLARLLKGLSAHSTRIGLTQDLFSVGEDIGGIMDALRWKSPRMPLAYNRNLAAEAGAAGRLLRGLE
ncbi:MAG: tyrosine-type recombinase/integrase [Janthinobacterium lividum]